MLAKTKAGFIIIAGFTLLLIGFVLSLPFIPGPGALIMLAGLALLAHQYRWARRMLDPIKQRLQKLRDRF